MFGTRRPWKGPLQHACCWWHKLGRRIRGDGAAHPGRAEGLVRGARADHAEPGRHPVQVGGHRVGPVLLRPGGGDVVSPGGDRGGDLPGRHHARHLVGVASGADAEEEEEEHADGVEDPGVLGQGVGGGGLAAHHQVDVGEPGLPSLGTSDRGEAFGSGPANVHSS